MKFARHAVLGISLVFAIPAFAQPRAAATRPAAVNPSHVKAVQDLLGAMQVENVVRRVAYRSRFQTDAHRQAVMAKLAKVPPAEIHRRLASPVTRLVSADTALEMTRFYQTPYGKQVVYRMYNSNAHIMMPGAGSAVPLEEKNARKRPAFVKASKELAGAQDGIEHEAFKLMQLIDKEKR